MFLVDDILLAPGKALSSMFEQLVKKARDEWLDDESVKKDLQQLYTMLESGGISEKEFEAHECRLLERLQQIAAAKFQERWGGETAPTPAPQAPVEQLPAMALLPAPMPPTAPPPAPPAVIDVAPPRRTSMPILDEILAPLMAAAALPSPAVMPTLPPITIAPPPAAAAPPPAPPLAPAPVLPGAAPPLVDAPPPADRAPVPVVGRLTISQVIDATMRTLAVLKLRVSTIAAVTRSDEGWRVTAELVERRSVPDSGDYLGMYELSFDEAGNLLHYERTRMRRRCDLTW